MKKLLRILVAITLLVGGSNLSAAYAYESSVEVTVAGIKATTKALTKNQTKFVKNQTLANPYYSVANCYIQIGSGVTKKQKTNLRKVMNSVCSQIKKADAHMATSTNIIYVDESFLPTQVRALITFNGLRNVMYNGTNSNGEFPNSSEPVVYNGKVTVAGNPGNLVNNGLEFLGWTKNNDGTGHLYVSGDKIKIKTTTNLFAKWAGIEVTANISGLGDMSSGKVGFHYHDPYSNFVHDYVNENSSATFEIGGFDGLNDQIFFSAPGYADESSLTATGDLEIHLSGWGTCGWSLDVSSCTVWTVKVNGPGTVIYNYVPQP